MYRTEDFELWNVGPGVEAETGPQNRYNIVGRLFSTGEVSRFTYELNGIPERPIFFNATKRRVGRLDRNGDFNIDTIGTEELLAENSIVFRVYRNGSGVTEHTVRFPARSRASTEPRFRLDLSGVEHPQNVGQVIDGRWVVSRDELGRKCLEIRKEDSGLDRIILFGRAEWSTGYEISMKFMVTAWMNPVHNFGAVFKWNPHLGGDGSQLPTQWSTGLAYYYSGSPGLRLRFGVDVYVDDDGVKHGDFVLSERPYSVFRYLLMNLNQAVRLTRRPLSQLVPGVMYLLRVRIHTERYTLTLWKDGRREPRPRLEVPHPPEPLPSGSVGVIAFNCAARVYEYEVTPLQVQAGRSAIHSGAVRSEDSK